MSGWHAKTRRRGFEDAVSSYAIICMGAAKDQWAAPPPHGTRQPVGLILDAPDGRAPGDLRQEQVAGPKTASFRHRVRTGRPSALRIEGLVANLLFSCFLRNVGTGIQPSLPPRHCRAAPSCRASGPSSVAAWTPAGMCRARPWHAPFRKRSGGAHRKL